MRLAPIGIVGPALLNFDTSVDDGDYHDMALGTVTEAVGTSYETTANVANWGNAELVWVENVSVAITPGTVCVMDKNFRVVASAAAASQVNTGQPVYIALTNFAAGSTTAQHGWVLRKGICPVQFSVAATTGRVYAGTAGKLTPTQANGAQLLNATTLIAGASTFTRSCSTLSGSSRVTFANQNGMYIGQAISGTGIPASSVISSLDPDGRTVVIGSAIGTAVNATATGLVTATMTNTGYGIVQIENGCCFQTQVV